MLKRRTSALLPITHRYPLHHSAYTTDIEILANKIVNQKYFTTMEWIKIDPKNLPENEVLAANFTRDTFGYKEKIIGYLSLFDDIVFCNNDNEDLEHCSHYIDLSKHDIA